MSPPAYGGWELGGPSTPSLWPRLLPAREDLTLACDPCHLALGEPRGPVWTLIVIKNPTS